MLKLIPTPMQIGFGTQEIFVGKEVCFTLVGETTPRVEYAKKLFEKLTGILLTEEQSQVRINVDYNVKDDFFKEKNASEQGYILKVSQSGEIVIKAQTDVGVLYAFATLAQLIEKTENGAVIKEVEIKDRPDFAYRGVNWLVNVEVSILSYDRGDGEENYVKRFVEKLDLMAAHKINVVYTDGFGWDTERTPTYADWNRKINDAARLRGIHLCYGGYGMSYGSSLVGNYRGIVHKNRYSYPDGQVYECVGNNGIGRTFGTCMSNETLMENKCEELRNFIKKIHPGALYIHNMDCGLNPQMWLNRCDECKKRWPDDSYSADNGMAGAFAGYLAKINETVKSVQDGDYDGRDCLIMFISPGYLGEGNTDEEFREVSSFWAAVDRNLPDGHNIFIGQREMFTPYEGVGRFEYLAQKQKNGKPAVIYFGGADNYFDDQMFVSTAMFSSCFKGAEFVIHASGKAGMEPLALANSEYMWNSENSAFGKLQDYIRPYDKKTNWIYGRRLEKMRPRSIYGENGLIDTACMRIWGEETGKKMADLYRLGEDGCPPILYMTNSELANNKAYVSQIDQFPLNWDRKAFMLFHVLQETEMEFQMFHLRLKHMLKATRRAAEITAANAQDNEDIRWMAERFSKNAQILSLYKRYADFYMELEDKFECGEDVASYAPLVTQLEQEAKNLKEELTGVDWDGVDIHGGSKEWMDTTCEAIEYFCSLMLDSIKNNDRIPRNIREFPKFEWM